MKIVEQGIIDSSDVLLDLHIVDFGRMSTNPGYGYWHRSVSAAINCCTGWLKGVACYTVVVFEDEDYRQCEVTKQFPQWDHVGSHVPQAQVYWNWFHSRFKDAELTLSDEPDFFGRLNGKYIYGDFGLVSPHVFVNTIKIMDANDLWITVQDRNHILIEPMVSIWELFEAGLSKPEKQQKPVVKQYRPIVTSHYTQLGFLSS